MHRSLFGLAALLGWATPALGHVGERLIPVYEISSRDLPDLHDGSLDDWDAVLPDASLQWIDFYDIGNSGGQDTEDLAFRVLLAWNWTHQRVYVALERTDDLLRSGPTGEYFELFVDGDHSGGIYFDDAQFSSGAELDWSVHLRRAQQYLVFVNEWPDRQLVIPPREEVGWATRPPWSDAGTFVFGQSPTYSATEVAITLWDDLDRRGPEHSRRTELQPWMVIGFEMFVVDVDDLSSSSPGIEGLLTTTIRDRPQPSARFEASFDASFMGDAQLIPCFESDCSRPDDREPPSAVVPDAWGRIKAALR